MRKLVGLIGLLVSLASCAFGNRSVNLTYPPGNPAGNPVPRQATATTPQPSSAGKVVLVAFLDQRPSKLSVGAVHNGYGMHTADAVASNSVPGWVMQAIKLELTKQGFEVMDLREIPQTSEFPIISGDILTVMCQAYTRYESTVEFSVIVSSSGSILLQKSYKGVDESTVNWAAGADAFSQSLAVAMQTAADNFAVEFKRLSLMTKQP